MRKDFMSVESGNRINYEEDDEEGLDIVERMKDKVSGIEKGKSN